MGRKITRPGRVAGRLGVLALLLALISAGLFLAAPLGYRRGLIDIDTALVILVPAALFTGFAVMFVALVRTFVAWQLKCGNGRWAGRLALLIVIVPVGFTLIQLQKGIELPRIHDITTDTAEPPLFIDIAKLRRGAPNSEIYGGTKVARLQQAAYPDIRPILLPVPPAEAFEMAETAAKKLHWSIVTSAPGAGRLEASDKTFWFHFTDDIVVRIRPDEAGSRIDVRSVSRVGEGDLGSNAARIRAFRAALR